jgi:hypothetical protein
MNSIKIGLVKGLLVELNWHKNVAFRRQKLYH